MVKLRRRPRQQEDVDAGGGVEDLSKRSRQQARQCRGNRAEAQFAEGPVVVGEAPKLANVRENALAVLQDRPSGFRRPDLPAGTGKQCHADLVLKGLDTLRDGGRRHAQATRRFRHRAVPHHGQEGLEKACFHIKIPYRLKKQKGTFFFLFPLGIVP